MSIAKFASLLESAKLRKNNRIWFARWVDAYRRSCRVGPNDPIPVQRESVIAFLRGQKAKGRKAWQRLQIVKATEYYRNAILRTAEPDLHDIRERLAQAAAQERSDDPRPVRELDVVGVIDPNEPEPIRQLRRELRLLPVRGVPRKRMFSVSNSSCGVSTSRPFRISKPSVRGKSPTS